MELGYVANPSPLDAQAAMLSATSIMTASFTKVVDSPAVTLSTEKSSPSPQRDSARAQMRPYLLAERNVFNGISMASTAHEVLGEMANVLEQMRSVVLEGSMLANAHPSKAQQDYTRLQQAFENLRENTTYNGLDLLGPRAAPATIDLGPLDEAGGQVQLNFSEFSWTAPAADELGSNDQEHVHTVLASIDSALAQIASRRTDLGESLNKLQKTTQYVQTHRLNSAAASSKVSDVSVAEEMARLSGDLVVRQPGLSILGQGEQLPQLSLGLLR
jgi:flagellin